MNYSQVTVDILQNPRYAGAIDSVRWITDWIDSGFGMVITIVAFLIILVAMFKNVLAGAYCAYPKFWDRVNQAHQEAESQSWVAQFKGTFNKDMNSGSLSNAIMRILPNIKRLTDFEGDTVAPKAYFIRAIPQMLLCVIIGAFIYNGYYRDTAAKVVDFGSEMVSRVLLEVDPVAVFDQFTGASGRPVFASDNATMPEGQLVNKIANEVYNKIIGEYNDIEGAEAKMALASAVESKAVAFVDYIESVDATYIDGESWKIVITASLHYGNVETGQMNGTMDNGTKAQYAQAFPVSDLNFTSNINVDAPMYCLMRTAFEKKAVSTGKHNVTDLQLSVRQTDGEQQITTPEGANLRPRNTSSVVTFTNESGGTISVSVGYASGSINSHVITVSQPTNGGSPTGVYTSSTGISIQDMANSGRTHVITSINFGGSGVLSSEKEGKSYDWTSTNVGVPEEIDDTAESTDPS